MHRVYIILFCILTFACLLGGCSGSGDALPQAGAEAQAYSIPAFRDAVFHEDQAEYIGNLRLDTSAAAQGYLALQVSGGGKYKFQVEKGEMRYNYDVYGDGSTVIIPLNMESGIYILRLLQDAGDNKYAGLWSGSREFTLESEFAPFLVPSQLVNYSEDSRCAALARELAADCQTDSDAASKIYKYLVKHIGYDKKKAATVQSGYLPTPDLTLDEGKGICFDYASLAAAMMRSLGIPCKLITGYVDGSIYHAWNCFYLKEQGWVTVEIKATPGIWQRIDTTMAASGTRTADLLDDGKYTTRYMY